MLSHRSKRWRFVSFRIVFVGGAIVVDDDVAPFRTRACVDDIGVGNTGS